MIGWAITFTAVLAFLAIMRVPLKRAVYSKAKATADYMFWADWGDEVKLEPNEKTSRAKIMSARQSDSYVVDRPDECAPTIKYASYGTLDSSNEGKISSGVEEGSEALLKTTDEFFE